MTMVDNKDQQRSKQKSSDDWTKKEREAREDERILEAVRDAMGLFGGFLGTGMFVVFSKTDCCFLKD